MTTLQATRISALSASELDTHLPALADVLHACVAGGASVNFLLPYSRENAAAFWRDKVRPGVQSGGLCLLAAWRGDVLEGTVQLDLDTRPTSRTAPKSASCWCIRAPAASAWRAP